MSLSWMSWTNPISFWWIGLVCISILNMLFWVWTKYYTSSRVNPADTDVNLVKAQVVLSAIYVFVCAYRSIFPKADVQRICLFDSWLSSVFLGRTVATVAELCFVLQWAIALHFFGKTLRNSLVMKLSLFMVPLIIVAECFSWFAVITTNYLGNTVEESLWAITYSLIFICISFLIPYFKREFRYVLGIAAIGCVVYVGFMATVDVPMYWSRWQMDSIVGKRYFGFVEGLVDLNTRWVVTHDILIWKDEIPWKTLYFSFAVWVSMALCYLPFSKTQLMRLIVPDRH